MTAANLVVTGGSGYIGSRLVHHALAQGRRVVWLGRSPDQMPQGCRYVSWSLGDSLPTGALDGPSPTQSIIHLAHDWHSADINQEGTGLLVESARALGVSRFVFASSQSSRADAINRYGQLKWHIEQGLDAKREVAARIGLVYGGPRTAMWGLLCKIVKLSPILPMVEPQTKVQPIHLDEVCRGLLALADGAVSGSVGLAAPDGVPFGDFLRVLAREISGRSIHILPVPLKPVLLACDVSARIPLLPTVDRERVLGLAGTREMTCNPLTDLGVAIEPFQMGIRREPAARRALLSEAAALIRYVGGRSGSSRRVWRQYATAVRSQGEGTLALPPLIRLFPCLLRLIEPFGRRSALSRRLALATSLIANAPEATRPATTFALLAHIGLDALCMPSRLVSTLLAR